MVRNELTIKKSETGQNPSGYDIVMSQLIGGERNKIILRDNLPWDSVREAVREVFFSQIFGPFDLTIHHSVPAPFESHGVVCKPEELRAGDLVDWEENAYPFGSWQETMQIIEHEGELFLAENLRIIGPLFNKSVNEGKKFRLLKWRVR